MASSTHYGPRTTDFALRTTLLLVLAILAAPQALRAQSAAPPPSLRAALLYGPAVLHTFPQTLPASPPGDTLQPRRDPWLGFDKVQHLTFSFLWTLGGQYALVNKGSLTEGRALPLSIGLSAGVGLAKELYDWRLGPTAFFSRRDLAADALGVALAAGFILL